jgi:signal transduction histidine kinase
MRSQNQMQNNHLEVTLRCPTGQDATLIASVLKKESIDSVVVKSISELCQRSDTESGVLLIADEALTFEGIELLNQSLSNQETWSDIPIILLTSGNGREKQFNLKRLEVFVASGNVTLLERPLLPLTLLSATQVALRTRRRQYQVRDLLESQQEATKIRDEFISIASHELKTPLTSLKLQTQMSKRLVTKAETFTPERIQKQLDYTIHQIDRLNKLVDDMLDITRINTGKLQLYKKPFDLSVLVEELVERFMPQFVSVGCQVKSQIEANIIGEWDSYKIEQVLNNLFSNAIRYSPRNPISIRLKKESDKAILNVQDQGIGIDPANMERIFERFERASSAASGLGLGLYITRQILDLHNGKIRVESELGKGSNFIIELPL